MITKRYSIYNRTSGQYMGTYSGVTETAAVVAMLADGAASPLDINPSDWICRELLSHTAAKRQARKEGVMYRQGSGWIVSTWDEAVSYNRASHELIYSVASSQLAEWRRERAAYLCGSNA